MDLEYIKKKALNMRNKKEKKNMSLIWLKRIKTKTLIINNLL